MLQETGTAVDGLLGLGRDAGEIGPGQMALRALVVYVVTLAVVRLGSRRFLGKATAFDVIMGIMIGSVMSRGINGSAELVPTLLAGAMLVALHWLFAVLSFHTRWFGTLVKGQPVLLVENGEVREEGMRRGHISAHDLQEALRLEGSRPDASEVRLAHLERDGSISVIPAAGEPRVLDVRVEHGVQTVRIALE